MLTEKNIMLDWLRNRRKSEREKREEAITAYLDDALSPRERAARSASRSSTRSAGMPPM